MAKIFLNNTDDHYQNHRKYEELVCKTKIYKGNAYTYHKYQDKHSQGLGFQVWKGFLAVLSMISVIGILFFRKQVLSLWNEACTGKQVYSVYQLRTDTDPLTQQVINAVTGQTTSQKKSKPPSKEELRIISRGLDKLGVPFVSAELIDSVKWMLTDPTIQQEYFKDKEHEGYSFIEWNGLTKHFKTKVDISSLKATLRLLILRGECAFMTESGSVYVVGFDPKLAKQYNQKSTYFDKQRLLQFDTFFKDHFVDINNLGIKTDSPERLKEIIDQINENLINRAKEWNYPLQLSSKSFDKTDTLLDLLVLKGVIDSYNIVSGQQKYHLKFEKDDPVETIPYKFNVWRDKSIIESEEKFKKENKIEVTSSVLKEFTGKPEVIMELISNLNKRIKPGPHEFFGSNPLHLLQSAAKFLQEKGIIFDYSKTLNGPLTVWVKPEDKN